MIYLDPNVMMCAHPIKDKDHVVVQRYSNSFFAARLFRFVLRFVRAWICSRLNESRLLIAKRALSRAFCKNFFKTVSHQPPRTDHGDRLSSGDREREHQSGYPVHEYYV
jgi:hypothetical protein